MQDKLNFTNKFKPDIILIGSSTYLQATYKSSNKSLFNASVGNINPSIVNYFINKLSYEPKIIIFSLDDYMFNTYYEKLGNPRWFVTIAQRHFIRFFFFIRMLKQRPIIYISFIKDLIKNFEKIKLNYSKKYYGLNSMIFNSGFRQDGSYKYPDNYFEEHREFNKYNYYLDVLKKQNKYDFSPKKNDFDWHFKYELDQIINNKKIKNTKKIFFQNVLYPEFLKALLKYENTSEFINNYNENICKFIKDYQRNDVMCFNFINSIEEFNIKNYHFYDPRHPDTKTSNFLTSKILKSIHFK